MTRGRSASHQKAAIIAPMLGLKRLARFINCREASRLLSQAQERGLSPRDWLKLRLHILGCIACTRVELQMRFLRQAMRRYRN